MYYKIHHGCSKTFIHLVPTSLFPSHFMLAQDWEKGSVSRWIWGKVHGYYPCAYGQRGLPLWGGSCKVKLLPCSFLGSMILQAPFFLPADWRWQCPSLAVLRPEMRRVQAVVHVPNTDALTGYFELRECSGTKAKHVFCLPSASSW